MRLLERIKPQQHKGNKTQQRRQTNLNQSHAPEDAGGLARQRTNIFQQVANMILGWGGRERVQLLDDRLERGGQRQAVISPVRRSGGFGGEMRRHLGGGAACATEFFHQVGNFSGPRATAIFERGGDFIDLTR